ncbi:peptidase C15, pyroglutamyl peptidase I-like protein [Microthyrium microscopicum]|uniref:Peptidase C15, pyroglutamyl peptidase I-like protein n=1 Tax=Microthyrium microscopicum TaxID=703497 RepID=A0A6A6UF80_9PEZI|nr:peptidase C15, pyroglutamyl peptidase I-like protein [Microthyrium microscopicum]
MEAEKVKVLLTGFGPFLDVKVNPAWEIVSRLPSTLDNTYPPIEIVTQQEPLNAAYHDIAATIPTLIEQHNPDVVILVGCAMERTYFAVEKGAFRDGYHQFPDVARKVITKAESKKLWSKSPDRLDSGIDIESVVAGWKSKVGKAVDVRGSNDVGEYVCGFAYYVGLEHEWKLGKPRNVLFYHVPPLDEHGKTDKGNEVTIGLIKTVAEHL